MIIPEKQKALIDIALGQVGVHEIGGNNSGPVVEMYQRVIGKAEKEPWCVSFIQWCVREVDRLHKSKTALYATESSQMLWTHSEKALRINPPAPGSIVVWTKYSPNDLPLSIGHVGIVKEVLNENFMLTIEGNTSPSDGIQREGDGVYLKRRQIWTLHGYMRTRGFLLPWAGI